MGKLFSAFSPNEKVIFAQSSNIYFYDFDTDGGMKSVKEGTLGLEYLDYNSCIKFEVGRTLTFDTQGDLLMVDGVRFDR